MAGGVRIDPDGVAGFADQVHKAGGGYEAGALKARDALDHQMPFGASNASVTLLAAKERYVEALNVAMDNLKAYADMTSVLVHAAQRVATEFSGADARSAANIARVNEILSGAAAHVAGINIAAQHVDMSRHS
ncbi:MAG TPA: hypothetical protein VFO77_08405 [Actinoplanes sp.]|nr:hypothetical protein [Actinoplanes sp.]